MSSSGESYSIETLRPGEIERVAEFLVGEKAGGLGKDEWLQKFGIFWDQNPFFDENQHARGWIIRGKRGAILGFLGNIPVRYVRKGDEEAAFWATTWFVAEQARARSLDLFRKFMAQDGILFDTTPTLGVEFILAKRFKFTRLNSQWIKTDYLRPVHLGACVKYVEWRFGNKAWLRPFSLTACMAAKALTSSRSLIAGPKRRLEVKVREIDVPPDDTDSWWGEYRSRHCYTLVRDKRAMRWLYYAGAFAKSRKVLEIRKDSSLVGFVALKLIRQTTWGLAEVVDWALLDMSVEILWEIADQVRRTVRLWSNDIAYVRVHAFEESMGKLLSRAGFWNVAGQARYYYLDRSKHLSSEGIYSTPVDGDRSLFP